MKSSILLKNKTDLFFLLSISFDKEAGMSLIHSITLDLRT